MNKKFLSAILFGALMVTSTGTFVSCKDYDDDIKGLQTQIDANKNAIAELQKLVGSGNWVTNVAASGSDLVVTMSNGSTVTVAGVKGADGKDGVDGKNAAEWTIGTDGFWYMDGEKTDKVAVAQNGKDGKNGVTAPSPSIENGMWVVYNWDAEKGEFVKEVTDVPAAGTSAFVVKTGGVYTLNIADENGEYQEIVLPATCDSFVVETPYKHVDVKFEVSTWTKWAAAAKQDAGKAMLAKYPELAEIAKNAPMKQGGMLPLIVTPAAVELSDAYSFSLQNANGTIANIELSAPVKGAGNLTWESGFVEETIDGEEWITGWEDKLVSRSAKDACLWSLSMEPAYDKKKYAAPHYASTSGKASLVVENEKGTAVRTAFAYTVAPVVIEEDAEVLSNNDNEKTTAKLESKAPYAESIDLFAPFYENGVEIKAPIRFENDYKNHYIIAVASALKAEQYGLSIAEDGHTLNIAKMPASELSVNFDLTVIALGLNGSVVTKTVNLTIGQEIAATGSLGDTPVTLGYNAELKNYEQEVRWDISTLGLTTATQLNQFLKNADDTNTALNLTWSYTDEDGKKWTGSETITVYDKDGKSTRDYAKAKSFGFNLNSKTYVPAVYDIRLTSKADATSNTVIYAAEGTLTVKNPTLEAIKLVPEFVEDNVLQIVGKANGTTVVYALENGLILANGIKVTKFEDVAYEEWEEADGVVDNKNMASVNWIGTTLASDGVTTVPALVINKYNAENAKTDPAHYGQLNKVRRIRATYSLFENETTYETVPGAIEGTEEVKKDENGDPIVKNPGNYETFEFDVIVKSAIYSETPTEVVTIPEAKLTLSLTDDESTEDVYENKVDIAKIYSAVYAYGPNAGKAYNLWDTAEGSAAKLNQKKSHNNYGKPMTLANADESKFYMKNSSNLLVSIEATDLANFGYTSDEIIKIQSGAENAPESYVLYDEITPSGKVTWKEILDVVYNNVDLTVVIDSKTYHVFDKVKHTNFADTYMPDGTTANPNKDKYVTSAYTLNTAAYEAYIADTENDAKTVKYLKLFKNYYSKFAYEQIEEVYFTGKVLASGLCPDLNGAATIEFVDATTGQNFASLSGTTITAGLASNVHMTTDEVEVPFKLIIKDKWGMTMEVPFTITVTE